MAHRFVSPPDNWQGVVPASGGDRVDQCCENPRRVVTCCAYDVPGLKRWDCLNCGRNSVVWSGV